MAIPRKSMSREAVVSFEGLGDIYRRAILELKETAKKRLIRDGRVLTAEAHRARVLIRETAEIMSRVQVDSAEWIAANVPKAYLSGTREASLALGELGLVTTTTPQPLIHTAAVQLLVNDLQDSLLDLDRSITRGLRQIIRRTSLRRETDKMVTERIAQGIIQGKARKQVSADIAARLIDELAGKPLTINGRKWSADAYAEMVARTKTAEASSVGTANRLVEDGYDLVIISAHGATDGCAFYEGKVFSISGASEKYPALDSLPNGGPPFHPNCKHRLAPFVDELASGAEIRRAGDVPASALGKSFAEVNKLPSVPERAARRAAA